MNSQPNTTQRRFYPPRISWREMRRQLGAIRFSLATLMIGLTALCVLCGGARFVFYRDVATKVSSEEANARFQKAWSLVRVPHEAKQVNLYAEVHGGGADFDISPEDFLAWSNERGWTIKERRSTPPDPPLFVAIGPNDVRHCYEFSNATHRGGWHVMYDIDQQRAWVHLSPR